ncbi:transcriptional regulator, XRE family with cupin sensor [Shimia gijangensis]|uniref:Transcriptional regulator, XRE family with cupin sensor n=1 Tax=Shimia gijangensis TaxID=1470563 RepID=A0A1M6J7A5_9RHOB|nr:cupin domain-containing protein [Shimia gijangensis]SHJ42579.1 transcriptional regulator, XRE family with cupin sensor [Shimia gijangensis]
MSEEFDVGARLRFLRGKSGLSQRQLAEAAAVPHGQISNIETNRSNPSVASLRRILGGLSITMSEFFEPDEAEANRVFFSCDELHDLTSALYGSDAKRMHLRQVGDARQHGLQLLHEHYAPGADTGETLLEHDASEGGIVISGALEVTVGDQSRILTEGEAYLFDSRLPHRFRNLSGADTIVVSACTPPYL